MPVRADSVSLGLRVSPTADKLLRQIASHLGVSKTSVLEIAIREKAKQEGIPVPVADQKPAFPDNGARSASDVYAMAARIDALGDTATLAEGADSREAIYGERA